MKLSKLISICHQTFAGVVFSFPASSHRGERNHKMNLKTINQPSQTKSGDSVPQYERFPLSFFEEIPCT
jgi:hypothetical protein